MRVQTLMSMVVGIGALMTLCGGESEPPYSPGDPPQKGFIALIQNGLGEKPVSADGAGRSSTPLAAQNLADGHLRLRKIVREIVPEDALRSADFSSAQPADLRKYAAHSQISQIDFTTGKGSTIESFFFCDDGTFSYRLTYSEDGSTPTPEFSRGVWEAVRDGMNSALVMHSDAPGFASLSIEGSGLMIFPIAQYKEEILQLGYNGSQSTLQTLFMKEPIEECP